MAWSRTMKVTKVLELDKERIFEVVQIHWLVQMVIRSGSHGIHAYQDRFVNINDITKVLEVAKE
jgi:hypothetical protein